MGVIPSEEEFCEERFLGNYGAAQAKQQNGQTVHYKHEYVRACLGKRGEFPSSDTLGWPSDAARIRDHYISILSTVNREERRTTKERRFICSAHQQRCSSISTRPSTSSRNNSALEE